jgi:hypothetical protein
MLFNKWFNLTRKENLVTHEQLLPRPFRDKVVEKGETNNFYF